MTRKEILKEFNRQFKVSSFDFSESKKEIEKFVDSTYTWGYIKGLQETKQILDKRYADLLADYESK